MTLRRDRRPRPLGGELLAAARSTHDRGGADTRRRRTAPDVHLSQTPGGRGTDRRGLRYRIGRLRELRSSGRSELLSGTLAALNEAGWPLRSLGEALGISRQAVQARVRRRAKASLRDPGVPCEPPPPFPQRRVASPAGLRPHLTIKIDHTLRVSAHRAAADEGSSLTQVVEAILDRYLRHGMADEDQAPREGARIAD